MPDVVVLEHLPAHVREEHAFVAGRAEETRFEIGPKADDGDAVGVVPDLAVEGPELSAVVIEEGVAHHDFILAVVVYIVGIGIVAGHAGRGPHHF